MQPGIALHFDATGGLCQDIDGQRVHVYLLHATISIAQRQLLSSKPGDSPLLVAVCVTTRPNVAVVQSFWRELLAAGKRVTGIGALSVGLAVHCGASRVFSAGIPKCGIAALSLYMPLAAVADQLGARFVLAD